MRRLPKPLNLKQVENISLERCWKRLKQLRDGSVPGKPEPASQLTAPEATELHSVAGHELLVCLPATCISLSLGKL